jgi:serine/threonine protein kinase
MFVGVSLGFSILRYRLWDIDFIINRSLVYGAMTAMLAILFGGNLILVSLFVQGQAFIIAFGVTAMIAGISFNPARHRIQRSVDQRFYHIKIDYQKTPPALATNGTTQVTHFGAYQNLELIGRGGMVEVYKSTNPTTDKPVAIKILPKALASETEFRQRFTCEAQVVSQLEHPNIIRIFDSGEEEGQYYMVMEYLTGQDLDRLIKNNGKLPFSQVLPLIQQIASALDYAHTQGFVHRDIKPSNVLLDSNGTRAVLTDFGIAKVNDTHTVMTVTGHMLGTFDYIAPEQIQESSHVDGKADIYALGVMVYQMLTGQLPFKHNNAGALLIVHLNQPAPDACEILSDLPRNVGVAIQRAMAKKPEERFSTAKEFAAVIG